MCCMGCEPMPTAWHVHRHADHACRLSGSARLSLATLDYLLASKSPCLSKAVLDAAIGVCATCFSAAQALRVYALMPQVRGNL